MANVFKYLTGNPSRKAIKRGNLARGIGGEAYGPTSATGYYAGVEAPDGGYVVTSLRPDNKPSYQVAQNDNGLIVIARELGGNVSTVAAAKTYLAGRANTWLADSTPTPTITDDLVLYLDPSNLACYPDGGNILYDLSGKGNNATLYNSPVISSGFITWNGSNEYAQVNFDASMASWANSQTIVMWLKHNISSGRRNPWDQAYGGYGTWTHEAGTKINNYFGDAGRNAGPYVGLGSSTIPKNKWTMVSTTRDTARHKWYLNDTNTHNTAHSFGTLTTDTNRVQIARGYAGYWQGKMGPVMAYDRALTQDEITSLYYGGDIVTDNLQLNIDAGNLCSFDPGETVAYSLNNDLSGSLLNGTGYSSDNGGTFVFDGSNDNLQVDHQNILGTFSDWSMDAWVRWSNSGYTSWMIVVDQTNYSRLYKNIMVWLSSHSDNKRIAMYDGSWKYSSGIIPPNTWTHISAATQGQTAKMYINGKFDSTHTFSWNSTQTADKYLGIGGHISNPGYRFNGNIATVKIYNKTLNDKEVLQNYNAHRSRFGL